MRVIDIDIETHPATGEVIVVTLGWFGARLSPAEFLVFASDVAMAACAVRDGMADREGA